MDIKELVKIVIEVVDEIMQEKNQITVGILFEKENKEKLKKEANFNKIFYYKDFNEDILPDVLYLDFISVSLLPNIALGLDSDNITRLIKNMLLNGKKIIVLGHDNNELDNCNNSYAQLFENYYKMLNSYGIIFNKEQSISNEKVTFNGKVLTRKEIIEYKEYKEILVNDKTVITILAKEEAQKYNIKIIKV